VTLFTFKAIFTCKHYEVAIMGSGEECITSTWADRVDTEYLNTVVELPILLEKVKSGQSACGKETKRDGSPEFGLDTPACCCTKQGDAASERELRAVVLILLEQVAWHESSSMPVRLEKDNWG
jgi:hypothetical protein